LEDSGLTNALRERLLRVFNTAQMRLYSWDVEQGPELTKWMRVFVKMLDLEEFHKKLFLLGYSPLPYLHKDVRQAIMAKIFEIKN
jgi:hypothetical protein